MNKILYLGLSSCKLAFSTVDIVLVEISHIPDCIGLGVGIIGGILGAKINTWSNRAEYTLGMT